MASVPTWRGMKVLDRGGWRKGSTLLSPWEKSQTVLQTGKKKSRSGAMKHVVKSEGDKYQKNAKWEKVSGWAGVAVFLSKLTDSTF